MNFCDLKTLIQERRKLLEESIDSIHSSWWHEELLPESRGLFMKLVENGKNEPLNITGKISISKSDSVFEYVMKEKLACRIGVPLLQKRISESVDMYTTALLTHNLQILVQEIHDFFHDWSLLYPDRTAEEKSRVYAVYMADPLDNYLYSRTVEKNLYLDISQMGT